MRVDEQTLDYQLSQGFSPWMPWRGLTAYEFMKLPGVYLFAELIDLTKPTSVVDPQIIYVGETTRQSLLQRFIQFEEAARTGCVNRHFGGHKYYSRTNGELIGDGHRSAEEVRALASAGHPIEDLISVDALRKSWHQMFARACGE